MSFDTDLAGMAAKVRTLPTSQLMADKWHVRFTVDRAKVPQYLWDEAWRRHCAAMDVLDVELEERWLKVAPPMKLGATYAAAWFRGALYDFATG